MSSDIRRGKDQLAECVRSLYAMGLTSSVSGNHSFRPGPSGSKNNRDGSSGKWIWITPSGMPRYRLRAADLVRVDLATGRVAGKGKPSIEVNMHRSIYRKRPDVGAIVHTHSPFTTGIAIAQNGARAFQRHVIEESQVVTGNPAIIPHRPSGSGELAEAVSAEFEKGARAVIIRNHGVVAAGKDIHEARAIAESLEEWAKILFAAQVFGGPKHYL